MNEKIAVAIEKRVAVITINRERAMNALDDEALSALDGALQRCADDAAIRVVVLTGAGVRAFSAGSDIKELARQTKAELAAHVEFGQQITAKMVDHPCILIAAIEGYCLGGGLEIALACDIRVAGAGASFGLPEVVRLNALPSWGGTFRLAPLVGMGRARELILLGRTLDADEALLWGLINAVTPEGGALVRALDMARALPDNTQRSALSLAKRLLTHGAQVNAHAAHYLEYLADQVVSGSSAFASSIKSFEKKSTE